MAKNAHLPIDPRTGLLDVPALIAFHRAHFGDARMEDPPVPPTPPTPPVPPPPPDPPAPPDNGFPANTPLEQMTGEQREAYWKHYARQHEERVKAFGGLTPEQVAELREKAGRHDALERELMSDKDKAVAEAADKAKADALAEVTPKLVRAEFKAALTGRVDADKLEERLTAIVGPLDLSKFLTASGDVDTAKVTAFVENIAPATGTSTPRRGPTATGHGSGAASGSPTALTGREMYEQRHKKATTTA